jgi:hypothetical protein
VLKTWSEYSFVRDKNWALPSTAGKTAIGNPAFNPHPNVNFAQLVMLWKEMVGKVTIAPVVKARASESSFRMRLTQGKRIGVTGAVKPKR